MAAVESCHLESCPLVVVAGSCLPGNYQLVVAEESYLPGNYRLVAAAVAGSCHVESCKLAEVGNCPLAVDSCQLAEEGSYLWEVGSFRSGATTCLVPASMKLWTNIKGNYLPSNQKPNSAQFLQTYLASSQR